LPTIIILLLNIDFFITALKDNDLNYYKLLTGGEIFDIDSGDVQHEGQYVDGENRRQQLFQYILNKLN